MTMGWCDGMGWGFGMGWGGWLFMGLFWLAMLVVLTYLLLRLLPASAGGGGRGGQETAEQILDRRFAGGEIDLETYQAQRAALRQSRGRK